MEVENHIKNVIGFLIKAALFIGILGGAIGYLPYRHNLEMNLACKEKFLSEPPYGQKVQVFDENINVVIEGEGDEVLILYPTAKLPTPYLCYKPLISALTSTFKVVTVEPFGYGLSDSTTRERSLENVVIELHEVVSSLGFDHYSILTDGFGGIPIMEYIDMYETEVKAYFNIDTLIGALNKQYNFVGDFVIYEYGSAQFLRFVSDADRQMVRSIILELEKHSEEE